MLREKNLVLTYAAGSSLFSSETFWVYVKSLKHITQSDFVLLTHDIDDVTRQKLANYSISIVDVPPTEGSFIFRDRHLAFWKYLTKHGHEYDHVLVTDCRDVVFQANPFDWIAEWKPNYGPEDNHFVILVSEGFKMAQSGFACIEHFEFQRDVPLPYLQDNKNHYVCNGGTMMGTPRAMQDFHFLMWMTVMKTIGRCTDQAALNYLMYYLVNDRAYNISFPQNDNLCLTGEGVKEGAVEPVLDHGKLFNPDGKLYYLIHQWDRFTDEIVKEIKENYIE